MALFLIQHGKSLPREKDPERGLSEEGLAETRAMASVAAQNYVQVKSIIHSGKKRALQTAEIFAEAIKPEAGISKAAGLAPMDDVSMFAAAIDNGEDLMVVGHLPFLERLVSYLVSGSTERMVLQFQNSGIVCLDSEKGSKLWFVRWAQFPRFV
ncbi:MAG: phosphohistidine phosphatase SixA [Desulfobulbales bacterium]|nr:phosphohistidine phosphatase SixA [Desulfobulbales bacterium]